MPGNNYNYGAAYIMNSDKTSVDTDEGASSLTRGGLEFDTRVQQRSYHARIFRVLLKLLLTPHHKYF